MKSNFSENGGNCLLHNDLRNDSLLNLILDKAGITFDTSAAFLANIWILECKRDHY